MGDLTISYYYHCDSNEDWSRTVKGSSKTYVVRFGRGHKNPEVVSDYSCNCPAYKFGKKGAYCKHIESVKSERCGWGEYWDKGKVVEKKGESSCPKCGAVAHSLPYGV